MAAPVMRPEGHVCRARKMPSPWERVIRTGLVLAYAILSVACLAFAVDTERTPAEESGHSRLTVLEQRVSSLERDADRIRAEERLARLEETTRLTLALLDRANNVITMLAVGMALMLAEAFVRNATLIRNGRKRET